MDPGLGSGHRDRFARTRRSQLVEDLKPAYQVMMGTADVIAPFGAVAAVPKLFVFDRAGARAGVFYGAPPDQHEKVLAFMDNLSKR